MASIDSIVWLGMGERSAKWNVLGIQDYLFGRKQRSPMRTNKNEKKKQNFCRKYRWFKGKPWICCLVGDLPW